MRTRSFVALFPLFAFACAGSSSSTAPTAPLAPATSASSDVDESVDRADREDGEEGDDPGGEAVATGSATASRAGDAILAEATRIFTGARATKYQHKTAVDESTGAFDVDCSGFVGYVLGRVAPDAKRELQAATVKRPLAKHFASFFQSLPSGVATGHWRRVDRAADLKPGDVIAWKRAADSHSKNTGHTLIVRDAVTVRGDVVEVPIFDSTATRHGRDDVRAAGSRSGVGEGTIVLRVDAAGRPVAFRWAVTGKYADHATEIGLGRVAP